MKFQQLAARRRGLASIHWSSVVRSTRVLHIGSLAVCLLMLSVAGCGKEDEERALYSAKSPDSHWIVDVAEHDHNGVFLTAESYGLYVIRIRRPNSSEEPALIFSMDSDGDKPAVTWVTNKKLSIAVANGSAIEHWSTRFRGIAVGVVLRGLD